MTTLDLQLKALRIAWVKATSEERKNIEKRAALLKLPPAPEEDKNLLEDVTTHLLTLPDYNHSYWDPYRK